MPNNVFLTGAPNIGKTTVIKHLLHDLKPLLVHGFYKEAIYENNICKGYRIITIDRREQILAHVYFESPFRIDQFGVNIEGFEKFILPELDLNRQTELFIIDEIGRMECLSALFCQQIKKIMQSPIPLIASIAGGVIHQLPIIKKNKGVTLLQVTQKNRDAIWKNILVQI